MLMSKRADQRRPDLRIGNLLDDPQLRNVVGAGKRSARSKQRRRKTTTTGRSAPEQRPQNIRRLLEAATV